MRWGRYKQFSTAKTVRLFKSRVKIDPKTGCHVWTGSRGGGGRYGSVGVAGRTWLAHRAAWFLFNGEDPGQSCICHHCDNGFCVNPKHLFKGTQGDNVRDMEAKNRSFHPKHEKHGRAKLCWKQVRKIRRLHRNGMAIRAIARLFPFVNRTTVAWIIKKRTWITT